MASEDALEVQLELEFWNLNSGRRRSHYNEPEAFGVIIVELQKASEVSLEILIS